YMSYPLTKSGNESGRVPAIRDTQAYFRYLQIITSSRLITHVPPPKKTTDLIQGALHYAVAKGHRWRPLLLLSTYQVISRRPATFALDAACGVELVHCCTIVLDDLPFADDAALRRGEQSCHVKYGEAN